ncbi:claudin-11b [Neoarius graeffei]|uniref:claudin-11b n=1 Tax=Neoarius graeffei TaxID=443677 RepID=UPI00298C65F8|nr:claudin-11b [Neoarius graeffei]
MSQSCRLLCGFFLSCSGWICLIVATSTNDWVIICSFNMNACNKMEQETKGLWAECVISTALYHCLALNHILSLPAYIQTSRALMVCASLLGLPSMLLALLATPCVRLGDESDGTKRKRALFGGILTLIMSACALVSTVWFPVGAHREVSLLSFGFSLYSGWMGCALCLLGGLVLTCCSGGGGVPAQSPEKRFYYSKQHGLSDSVQTTNNHAKSAHV